MPKMQPCEFIKSGSLLGKQLLLLLLLLALWLYNIDFIGIPVTISVAVIFFCYGDMAPRCCIVLYLKLMRTAAPMMFDLQTVTNFNELCDLDDWEKLPWLCSPIGTIY